MSKSKATPMMAQYNKIKSQHQDTILFFRLGDFYEMFNQDAITASEILDITLTKRGEIPMCGVPFHSAEAYIAKLNQKGLKVALCEQVSQPQATGIVDRKVTRIVTPSTNLSDYCLDPKANKFLAGLHQTSPETFYLALTDISTREIFIDKIEDFETLLHKLELNQITEIAASEQLATDPRFHQHNFIFFTVTQPNNLKPNPIIDQTLQNLSSQEQKAFEQAIFHAFNYLEALFQQPVDFIKTIKFFQNSDSFLLDSTTIKNLEIFYTNYDFNKQHSLLSVIDNTQTAAGGRLLRKNLLTPLKNLTKIQNRLSLVENFTQNPQSLNQLQKLLSQTADLERILTKLNLKTASIKEVWQLLSTLKLTQQIQQIPDFSLLQKLSPPLHLIELLDNAISPDCLSEKSRGLIFKAKYNFQIDEFRSLLFEGKQFILDLQQKEIAKTGITNLKISYNKVFGYYLEVSKGRTNLVPDYFIRKQTLTNAERYITPELKQYEEKVLNAETALYQLETELFDQLIDQILLDTPSLQTTATLLAQIDLSSSLAQLARRHDYTKPTFNTNQEISITDGRHPVLETLLPKGSFVPNNTTLQAHSLHLLTGPNMGGKSTYLRQTAIIVLLAQIGSFVPATSANLGLVDQIFTRVGANDNLTAGQSTFMVEMQETAFILRNATSQSLLIFDEIGRGTSTYDGLSLAWSIFEYIHNSLQSRTLFATHYHELITLADKLPQATNFSVAVEDDGRTTPVFLHKIQFGPISKSYGVHVAQLAGLPAEILTQANSLLLERQHQSLDSPPEQNQQLFPDLLSSQESQSPSVLQEELAKIDVNQLTPVEALLEIQKLKNLTQ